jgi:hypothetical protein
VAVKQPVYGRPEDELTIPQNVFNHTMGNVGPQDAGWQGPLPGRNNPAQGFPHSLPVGGATETKTADPLTPPAGSAPPTGGNRGYGGLSLSGGPQVNSQQFRGFNDDRALSGGDPNSVKDGFRRFAGAQQGPTDTSKEGLDAWLTALIPQASEYGLNIRDVVGDQMLVNTAERGDEWIDFYQNAGGEDGAFQWLDLASQGEQGGGGDALGLQGAPGGSDLFAALMADGGLNDNDTLKRIQEELLALSRGGASPIASLSFDEAMR